MNRKTGLVSGNKVYGIVANKKLRAGFLYLPAFLLLANVFISCNGNNSAPQTNAPSTKDSLTAAQDSLQVQNNASHAMMDDYAAKSAMLDSLITQKDKAIEKLRSINGHLEKNNSKLASQLKTDKKLIASLKDDLNERSKAYEQQLGLLENDKNDLLKQRDSLVAKYNKVLALGSVLHASNIRLMAIHLKRHGTKEKDTKRARRADELKVNFDIDENRVAENGTKKLYLVIKDPKGNLLSNAASGSGSTTASNGSQMNYTVLKEIPLVTNEPVKDISVEWKQEGDYEKGDYTITIYNGGYRIGGGQVELK